VFEGNHLWEPCLRFQAKRIVDIARERFLVPGVQSQTSDESRHGLSFEPSEHSLQIKPVITAKAESQNTT